MIFQRFGHIALTLLSCLIWVACDGGSSDRSDAPDPAYPRKTVNLSFSVGVLDAAGQSESRAIVTTPDDENYFEREASRYECLHTIRIIILRYYTLTTSPSDTDVHCDVEHNRLVTIGDDNRTFYDDLNFEVLGGEKKRIYILANEDTKNTYAPDGTLFSFDTVEEGKPYVDGTIEDLVIRAGAGGYLYDNSSQSSTRDYVPMSEVYDIFVEHPENPELRNQDFGPFFITRSAVKFSFTIATAPDYPDTGLKLKNITVNSINNSEFMLPRATVYSPAKDEPSSFDFGGRFITAYETPEGLTPSPINFPMDLPVGPIETGKAILYAPAIYYPESPTGDYTVSITLGDADSNEHDHTFDPVTLDNLPALPRNTHVLVNLTLTAANLTAEVKLVPYIGVPLSYFFGFEELVPWEHGRPSNDKTIDVPEGE